MGCPAVVGIGRRGRSLAITITMVGLLVAAAGLVVRFRRADGPERQQLRWMTLIAVPIPGLVVVSVIAALYHLTVLRTVATGGFVRTLIPIAAGLSVLRYRLYDVDRVVGPSRGGVCGLERCAGHALHRIGRWDRTDVGRHRRRRSGAVRHRRRDRRRSALRCRCTAISRKRSTCDSIVEATRVGGSFASTLAHADLYPASRSRRP